ncbi:hypothetical protein [Streptomyces sp. NPDC058268]|uniref:hypothetical protein n=1 Tax=Streptomyces sp. NPDC058268 TaxID=3346413 RepID=UPI0036EEF549
MANRPRRIAVGISALTLALVGVSAPSASAATVRCTYDGTSGGWNAKCSRYTNDGDAGGVSGTAAIQNNSLYADIEFEADGELVSMQNYSGRSIKYVLKYWDYGTWETEVNTHFTNDVKAFNLSIPEGRDVTIEMYGHSSGNRYVALSTLKS